MLANKKGEPNEAERASCPPALARRPWRAYAFPKLFVGQQFATTEPQKKQEVLTFKSKNSALGIRQKAESPITINFSITEPQKKQEVFTFNSKNSALGTPTKSGDFNHH